MLKTKDSSVAPGGTVGVWQKLKTPFFVLAPMDGVTDTVFRRVIAGLAPPDLFFTEFVNVDALQSAGRAATWPRLRLTDQEQPIIAQFWGLKPENFYQSAREISALGYAGVDLNFGCPDKNVVRAGACSAFILPENRLQAAEIIQATKEGAGSLPVSVKTRLGFKEVDLSWHEFLLGQGLDALTIHGRTKAQMSKVPADWSQIAAVRALRDRLAPATKIVGNGDVLTRHQGERLAKQHNLDGIMIGRGVFSDPYVFAGKSPWKGMGKPEKIALFKKHAELFYAEWGNTKSPAILKRFAKIYISGFAGAKELREKIMTAKTYGEMLKAL